MHEQPLNKWIKEGKFAYMLHETGRYVKGNPEVCNKFYFSIQPDYSHGITESDAANELNKLLHRANNFNSLLEALKIELWAMENGEYEAQRQGKPRLSERLGIIKQAIQAAEQL